MSNGVSGGGSTSNCDGTSCGSSFRYWESADTQADRRCYSSDADTSARIRRINHTATSGGTETGGTTTITDSEGCIVFCEPSKTSEYIIAGLAYGELPRDASNTKSIHDLTVRQCTELSFGSSDKQRINTNIKRRGCFDSQRPTKKPRRENDTHGDVTTDIDWRHEFNQQATRFCQFILSIDPAGNLSKQYAAWLHDKSATTSGTEQPTPTSDNDAEQSIDNSRPTVSATTNIDDGASSSASIQDDDKSVSIGAAAGFEHHL